MDRADNRPQLASMAPTTELTIIASRVSLRVHPCPASHALPAQTYSTSDHCTPNVALIKPLHQCAEKRHLPCCGPLSRLRTVIAGQNTTEAVDVLWVSTGFFVGVIDMAVVL
jgi:hypothetical protein